MVEKFNGLVAEADGLKAALEQEYGTDFMSLAVTAREIATVDRDDPLRAGSITSLDMSAPEATRLAAVMEEIKQLKMIGPSEDEYPLTADETAALKRIVTADEYLQDMSNAALGLSALNTVLGFVVPGPTKIAIKWNSYALGAWKKLNEGLAVVAKSETCKDLDLLIIEDSPAKELFERLSIARGCAE